MRDSHVRRGNTVAISALAVVLVVASGVGGFSLYQSLKGSEVSGNAGDAPRVEVPSLVGLQLDESSALLVERGFNASLAFKPGDDAPAGTILSQEPAAGSQAPEGSTVSVLAAGERQVYVPNLEGVPAEVAVSTLKAAGVTDIKFEEVPSTQPAGSVVSQVPAAGALVEKGTQILLRVPSGTSIVPDTVGATVAAAVRDLEHAGFSPVVTQLKSDTPGIVTRQEPAAGTRLENGAKVTLYATFGNEAVSDD